MFFRLIRDDISLAEQNTALVFDSCSIFLGSGDTVCYQSQTIQYYIIIAYTRKAKREELITQLVL